MYITPTVFIVDDDDTACQSVAALVASMDLAYECFNSAEDYLAEIKPGRPGCLVTDLRMLGMSGLDLLQRLKTIDDTLPVIVITAYASIPVAVKAVRSGAFTFLEKSCVEHDLWRAIQGALKKNESQQQQKLELVQLQESFEALTTNEREVLDRIAGGMANKQVAHELGISVRTVEDRRRRIMKKMGSVSFADLMRLVVKEEELEGKAE
jgi:two-component system, LuxR family, response regulator FixJ